MQTRDLSSFETNEEITCDICIVGSGPAGATLAQELAGSGLRILMLAHPHARERRPR